MLIYLVVYYGDTDKDPLNKGCEYFFFEKQANEFTYWMQAKGYYCYLFECKLIKEIVGKLM